MWILAGYTTIVLTTNNIDDNDLIHKSAMLFWLIPHTAESSTGFTRFSPSSPPGCFVPLFHVQLRSNQSSGTRTQLTPRQTERSKGSNRWLGEGSICAGGTKLFTRPARIVRALHARLDDRLGSATINSINTTICHNALENVGKAYCLILLKWFRIIMISPPSEHMN